MTSSWLFPDGVDRERMLEMERNLRPVRRVSFAVLGAVLLACGPWLGWWTIGPLIVAAIGFRIADETIDKLERPEWAMFGAWAASEVIIAVSCAVSGGPLVPTTSWLALPLVTLGARFSERGIALGVGISLVLLLAVTLGVNPHAVLHNPPLVLAPMALMVSVAMFQTVLMRSDVRYRIEAVIDPLTGMLNRKALAARVAELGEQSRLTRQPVGVIVGDIDCFKAINDSHGHIAGDAVLKDVAYALRKELRTFDLSYRVGGEEFVVLVPGAGIADAAALAERLRLAVEAEPLGGHRVTMSFGVGAPDPGEPFAYDAVFHAADAALYAAKRGGRNRVEPQIALAQQAA